MFLVGLLVAVAAFIAAGCGGGGGGGAPEALPSSSCTAIEYEGDGNPDYIVASDFPLQGSSRTQTVQINDAIRFELKQRSFKAGKYKIGFQACDDATAQAGKWDSGKASQNANAYAANDKVIGVIGTFNSGAAAIEIPVLNQAPNGGIAMISPANTYVCLTQGGPGCDKTEPDKYYPSGTRNYARVVANDAYQGAAVAEFAQSKGIKKVYVLNDKEAYGLGVATNFRNAATSLGIEIAGFEAWDPKASSYEALFKKIQGTGADAVFLGGLIDENGAQVIKDKVAVLGPNDGKVKLFAPDGFTTQQTIDEAGPAAKGMFMSVAGVPIDKFAGPAKEFAQKFEADYLKGKPIDPYAIYGAQAAQVLFDAIANSDGSRGDVIKQMFATQVTDGLLGSFKFNANGDPQDASGAVVGFTIYVATDKLTTETTISPKPEVVTAAAGG
ncbi:branched-chain amino acid ABC transporter substrate-binding protein [Gaiella occulta]|uniref:branched-chain amino acid ABC transporter substrate-binding protein n=1 Tax=Gaiella occulta TaxID=1002870 RepID=UPI0015F08176|nr:branched-chain amino acid ABC transporter substrate-binding protein [Gaiella occulta]